VTADEFVLDVDAHADSPVVNSQPAGIGRVATLTDLCAWNNLGRNIVFADMQLRPVGVFAATAYPDDDELSQYDLDVHAILELPAADVFVALNHLGALRAFRASELRATVGSTLAPLTPAWTATFCGDVERAAVVGDRLVGSRPRCDGAHGVVVSQPIRDAPAHESVGADVQCEDWGEVTALEVVSVAGADAIVLGGVGRIGLFPFADGRVERPAWELDVDFRAAAFAPDRGVLWVAGCELPRRDFDDYDWESLRGGGFAGINVVDGTVLASGQLPSEMAWGNGGVAVVVAGGVLCGLGRTGRLHRLTGGSERDRAVTAPLSATSLGIAHAAAVGGRVLFGFNRGGYILHVAVE
jgi:hypothetical protein